MNHKLKGIFSLLFATVIWGSAFIAQSVGMDYIEPFTFQAVRCFLAVLFLIPVIFLFDRDKGAYFKKWADPKLWKAGLFCGIALFAAGGLQQVGLVYTSAGKAGFMGVPGNRQCPGNRIYDPCHVSGADVRRRTDQRKV